MGWLPELSRSGLIESVVFSKVDETPVYNNISPDTGQGILI